MGVIGYMISIPVFCDSAFILLSTLNKTLSRKAGVSIAATSVALALGLLATHTLVPPTPGPVAAAGILGADLTKVILLGFVVAAAATAAGIFFASKIAVKTIIETTGKLVEQNQSKPPSTFKSALPVLVPILLILLKSISIYFADAGWQSTLKSIFLFTGEPFIALLIGFACCLLLPERIDKKMFAADGWTGKALESAASILFITAAGGVFGKVLQQADAAGELGEALTASSLGLFLPFLLAAVLKTAQGSSTVAMITAASVLSPLMISLGFESEWDKALVVIAVGAGSMVISHVNDSFFWVVTQLTGMNVKTGYKLLSLGTFIVGTVAMIALSIVSFFFR
jgi:GntP family gluconate:H+ symporter